MEEEIMLGPITQGPSQSLESNAPEPLPEAHTAPDIRTPDMGTIAANQAKAWAYLPAKRADDWPRHHISLIAGRLREIENGVHADRRPAAWRADGKRLIETGVDDLKDQTRGMARQPMVRLKNATMPRAMAIALGAIAATEGRVNEQQIAAYISGVESVQPLGMSELHCVIPYLKLALLLLLLTDEPDFEAVFPEMAPRPAAALLLHSLRAVGEVEWPKVLEPLMGVDRILREDPTGIYARMDFETRVNYRRAVAETAARSDMTEVEITRLAIQLARESAPEDERRRHVGFFLIDDGLESLRREAGYNAPFFRAIQDLLRGYPDEFYVIGIEVLALAIVAAVLTPLVQEHAGFDLILCVLFLFLPATQVAVEVMNYLATTVLQPRAIPKLDFEDGVPVEYSTVVAVPVLLVNQRQIDDLLEDMEIRYLANRDPNVHFVLLSDLPDSAEAVSDDDPRVLRAVHLINDLNRRYRADGKGTFSLLHRHHVFNPREQAFMGWERKRGKLLDLNQLLRKSFDPFPVKAGPIESLPRVAYVLTVDADTRLPRGSVHRMIGAMAHPLNRPVVDEENRIVVKGYGILQPRVGVSVHSARRSRLANIFSGQTGLDIYTRAVSDVYQDLYGEGIFTGKGIYDIDTFRAVLEKRFPRNRLLSHDLIEGAYSRVGLLSDVEVIDDYPSHYSAYTRRKHRWQRGDWQIARWIGGKVPDESGRLVSNPISLVARWRIVDNLRRSLVEPGFFFLFLAGWFFLPETPAYWTITALAMMLLPHVVKLVAPAVTSLLIWKKTPIELAMAGFVQGLLGILLNLIFLAHQTLVSLDAMIRTTVRSTITHSQLLQWETAYEAEVGLGKASTVDLYLRWTPAVSVAIFAALFLRPQALLWAIPIVGMWGLSRAVAAWADKAPVGGPEQLSNKDRAFLHSVAFETWQYFEEFSGKHNHSLIPDNVREPEMRPEERLSPTNLGFLLNARQAGFELGYLTPEEFVSQTLATLSTLEQLPKHRGHLLNWYDNATLTALQPFFVSTVDSGNLAASLWCLEQGLLSLKSRPLIEARLLDGVRDAELDARVTRPEHSLSRGLDVKDGEWLSGLIARIREADPMLSTAGHQGRRLTRRTEALVEYVRNYLPWELPEFAAFRTSLDSQLLERLRKATPLTAPALYSSLLSGLQHQATETYYDGVIRSRLLALLEAAQGKLALLNDSLEVLASRAGRFVMNMDFSFLLNTRRQLLCVGFDLNTGKNSESCYDLLASESRVASFMAIAKGDVPEEVWFRLGRQHVRAGDEAPMVSWTGTMFEYLMPLLWMNTFRDTLLDRAARACVVVQQSFAAQNKIPWGISESAFSATDDCGNFQYAAFGVPSLALNPTDPKALVISPYSSCLALLVDQAASIENLRHLHAQGWRGPFGFYEAIDFTQSDKPLVGRRHGQTIPQWMAHHQGMSLLALCSLLADRPFQRWFHSNLRVQAAELILQERPILTKPEKELSKPGALAMHQGSRH